MAAKQGLGRWRTKRGETSKWQGYPKSRDLAGEGHFTPWPGNWWAGRAKPLSCCPSPARPNLGSPGHWQDLLQTPFLWFPLNLLRKTWLPLSDSTRVLTQTPPSMRFCKLQAGGKREEGRWGGAAPPIWHPPAPPHLWEAHQDPGRQAGCPADGAALGATCLPAAMPG